ncbi:MAG: 4-oxalocrotonate tautomerase family protein [Phycisphaerales bacterium JB040]
MPYVNIKVTDDGVTAEQKSELFARVTDALVEVLGKRPDHIHIVLDEVPQGNWGFAGLPTDRYRAGERRE